MKKILACLCAAFIALHSVAAAAFTNDGVEEEPLYFGQIVITDNSASRSCTIPAGGTMTCDLQIMILQPGRYGVFQLSNYDPSVYIWASVDDTSTTMTDTAGTTAFDIKSFTFAPDINNIGNEQKPGGGTLLLYIGATLKTRAGETYDLSTYRGTYSLQINY